MKNAFLGLYILGTVSVIILVFLLLRAGKLTSESTNLKAELHQRELVIERQNGEIRNLQFQLQACESRTVTTYQAPDPGSGVASGSGGANVGSGTNSKSSILEPMNTPPPAKKQTTITKKTPTQTTQRVVVEQAPPASTIVVTAPKAQSSTTLVFPSYFYEGNSKDAKYCVRVDGRSDGHLPHLAINDGRIDLSDPTILANNTGGYDWISSQPLPDFVGDWGIVQSGNNLIFFVSARLIDLYLQPGSDQVEINAPATRNIYKKMTKFEDYYVYYAE